MDSKQKVECRLGESVRFEVRLESGAQKLCQEGGLQGKGVVKAAGFLHDVRW